MMKLFGLSSTKKTLPQSASLSSRLVSTFSSLKSAFNLAAGTNSTPQNVKSFIKESTVTLQVIYQQLQRIDMLTSKIEKSTGVITKDGYLNELYPRLENFSYLAQMVHDILSKLESYGSSIQGGTKNIKGNLNAFLSLIGEFSEKAESVFRNKTNSFLLEDSQHVKRPQLKEAMLNYLRHVSDPTQGMGWGREPSSIFACQSSIIKFFYKPNSRDENGKLRLDSIDDRRALDGRGIALTPKHQLELVDPYHRGWQTLHNEALVTSYRNWKEDDETDLSLYLWADAHGVNYKEGRVVYMKPSQSIRYLVGTSPEGKLFYKKREERESLIPDGNYIYVMDLSGNLYIASEGPDEVYFPNRGRIQHPSFTAGGRVLCAGSIDIKSGLVTHVQNASGHYLPGAYSLSRFIDELEKRKVLAPDIKVGVIHDERFVRKEKRWDGFLNLTEFKDVLRVWPRSPLAKLDLSEKNAENRLQTELVESKSE